MPGNRTENWLRWTKRIFSSSWLAARCRKSVKIKGLILQVRNRVKVNGISAIGVANLCLRKDFREGGRLTSQRLMEQHRLRAGPFFFGGGQYNRRFAQSGQEASLTHPLNACGLRGVLRLGAMGLS